MISTNIDSHLWKQAQMNDIKWVEALETGVKMLLGATDKKKEDAMNRPIPRRLLDHSAAFTNLPPRSASSIASDRSQGVE